MDANSRVGASRFPTGKALEVGEGDKAGVPEQGDEEGEGEAAMGLLVLAFWLSRGQDCLGF